MRLPAVVLSPCCGALLAACTGLGHCAGEGEGTIRVERAAALPPALAAAIVGGAMRRHLPFADAMPVAAGVLATPTQDGHWRLAWLRRGHDFIAIGSHRLRVAADAGSVVAAAGEAANDAPGTGLGYCRIDVHPDRRGSWIVGDLPPGWLPALDHALQLAADPTLPLPGLDEPNLARLAHHRLRADALASERRGDAATASRQRRLAARLAETGAPAFDELAASASEHGLHELANDHAWRAVLAADGPLQRARNQQRLQRSWLALADEQRRELARATAAPAAAPLR
jgi:hypothetical protein